MKALFDGDEGAYAYLNGLFDGSDGLFPVTITDVPYKTSQGTKVYEQDGLTIYALGIPHGDVPCLAFRIESAEGVMVISADQNGSNPDFIDFAKGADILLMPSSINPSHSLTLWDATSSEKTLGIISIVAIIVVPVILGYTAWCYYKMFGRLDNNYIRSNSSSLY